MRLAHPFRRGRLAPDLPGLFGDPAVAGPGHQFEAVRADLLTLLGLGERLVGLHLLVGDEVGAGSGQKVGAGCVQVPGQRPQQGPGVHGGAGRLADLVHRGAPLDVARLVHGVHVSPLPDLLRGEPGQGRRPLGGELLHVVGQFPETLAAVGHELLVVEPLVDDDVEPGEGQRQVGTGAQRQPEVGLGGGLREARVDDDHLHPLGLELGDVVHLGHPGGSRVLAPEHQAAARAHVQLEGAPAVDGGLHHEGGDPAQVRVVEAVRGAEQVHEAPTRPVVGALGSPGSRHRLGPVLLADLEEPVADLAQRLVPGDLFPFPLAPLSHPLQRVVDAGGMVQVLQRDVAPAAQPPLVGGELRVPLDLQHPAVLDVSQDPAVLVAEVTGRLLNFNTWLIQIHFFTHSSSLKAGQLK